MRNADQILAADLAERLGVGEYELQSLRFEHRLPFFFIPGVGWGIHDYQLSAWQNAVLGNCVGCNGT